ncbi:hypothetical protein BDQ17DRAFT_274442 [Cyathus striatus]|nr:hypothetical protein BDQ17DRAFT_274442 [Cyathus striatus]
MPRLNVFNPKILDASIRDISACLTDNQKVDLLLYAIKSLHFEGRSRIVVENAIQSCLQVSTLAPETVARARILRARARIGAGSHLSAQEGVFPFPFAFPFGFLFWILVFLVFFAEVLLYFTFYFTFPAFRTTG